VGARHQLGETRCDAARRAHHAGQAHIDGQHAAQGLEGAEAEALRLVLHQDIGEAQPLGEDRQPVKRRDAVGGTLLEHLRQVRDAGGGDHRPLRIAIGLVAPRTQIGGKPGKSHIQS
jgi:hypothetical protein